MSAIGTSDNDTAISARFHTPVGVEVDTSGNVYVAKSINNLIRKIASGAFVTTVLFNSATGLSNGTGTNATFDFPQYFTVDTYGVICVGASFNNLICKIQ